jgi:hypothetical protein
MRGGRPQAGRWKVEPTEASLTEVTPSLSLWTHRRGMDGCCLLMHGRDSASYPCFLLTQACDGSRVIHAVALVVNEGDLENAAHLDRLREQVRSPFHCNAHTYEAASVVDAIPPTHPRLTHHL